ncbi:MAG: hypothetical protein JO360_06695, partial [Acidobacteria bacterium]|nr:hypothetical protein [Acidobacteriota bacterium]
MKRPLWVLPVCLMVWCCAATSSYGQKVWEKKPYQQWSLTEALKILVDSPWAQTSDMMKDADYFSTQPGRRLSD